MSERGSFWSTVPGVVTGAAGVLTALVGLLTVSIQLGWIGGGSSGGGTGTPTTLPGATTSSSLGSGTTVRGSSAGTGTPGGSGQTGASSGTGQFTVEPTSVTFAVVGPQQATVVVRNTGEVPLTIKTPTVSGTGAQHFLAGDVTCTKERLMPGRTCEIQVAFTPKSGGAVAAKAVIAAAEAPRQVEVELKGSSLLG